MQAHVMQKSMGGAPKGAVPATAVEPQADAPTHVESDERAGVQPMDTTEEERGPQGATAVESTAPAPAPLALPQQPSREGQPVERRVESTWREGRGLRKAPPAEIRRSRVAFAPENPRAHHYY